METNEHPLHVNKLHALRTELVDLAFTLECQGRLDAADVAVMTANRVGELCDEIAPREMSESSSQR